MNQQPLVQSFIGIHTALRNDLKALDSAIQRREFLNIQDLERLNKWFEFYWNQLGSHHHGEDTYFYPAIGKYDTSFLPEVEKLTAQHHELDHLADELKATYVRLSGLRSGSERDSLTQQYARLISTLYTSLDSHLTHEEALLFPSIATHIPASEQKVIDENYLKKLSKKELAITAPWLLANISSAQKEEIYKSAPWIMRFLYNFSWKKKYEALVATFQI